LAENPHSVAHVMNAAMLSTLGLLVGFTRIAITATTIAYLPPIFASSLYESAVHFEHTTEVRRPWGKSYLEDEDLGQRASRSRCKAGAPTLPSALVLPVLLIDKPGLATYQLNRFVPVEAESRRSSDRKDESSTGEGSIPADRRLWIGRRFVPAGEYYYGSMSVVRETELPVPYRVFRPGRRIGDMSFQAERINIFLDERMIIIDVTSG
jgi:hypothetical protein